MGLASWSCKKLYLCVVGRIWIVGAIGLVKRVDFRLEGNAASSSVYGFELTEISALKFWTSTGAVQVSWSE
jgi:hypothetical protein